MCDWFLPGYLAGGPIQSIATLTKQLGNDINFRIITTDRDFRAKAPYEHIVTNTWTNYDGRDVFYISPENMNADFVLKLIQTTPHDVIYMNSLYSKLFTIYPLKWKLQKKINSKIVLAPRGMLRDRALAVKPLKKHLFLLYARFTGLFKNIHWQSTSRQESLEIKKRIGEDVKLTEVSNLPAACNDMKTIEKHKGDLRLCFIARIVDIKNLNFAIEVLKDVKAGTIVFDVYGPKEDEDYWRLCESNAKTLPAHITFNYKSVLKPEEISDTISRYHALFLPTQTENFGHVIVEALKNGRLVIISDQTPWRHLQAEYAGFDISLDNKQQFVDSIDMLVQLNQSEFDVMSKTCITYINHQLNLEEIKAQYLELFN
ncbi:MAG: glycosyltransferase family 4 protein [Bacteroidetes bacterium]|nr:glycosyltransferase family 4 protein [Bacteroidota bacterium]